MARFLISVETREGFETVLFSSITLGFIVALLLEMGCLGVHGLPKLSTAVVIGIPTIAGLTCGISVAWINRCRELNTMVALGWAEAYSLAAFFCSMIVIKFLGLWQLFAWGVPASMIVAGVVGFFHGLSRATEGQFDVPRIGYRRWRE